MCIGLFGSCGSSPWRDRFIKIYELEGIPYFNPQKDDWCSEDAAIEAAHLVNDAIILFPVTRETYGTGSLAETGFSIMQAIRATTEHARFVVVMIDRQLNPELASDPVAFKESIRARALVLAHLAKIKHPNVFVVESLDEMLKVSLELNNVVSILDNLRVKYD